MKYRKPSLHSIKNSSRSACVDGSQASGGFGEDVSTRAGLCWTGAGADAQRTLPIPPCTDGAGDASLNIGFPNATSCQAGPNVGISISGSCTTGAGAT